MKDAVPYIIVDNQKIAPVRRSPRAGISTAEPKAQAAQTFGIVDRVTISGEAREKYRRLVASSANDASTHEIVAADSIDFIARGKSGSR